MVGIEEVRAIAATLPRSYEAVVRLAALDEPKLHALVVDPWSLVVPKRPAAEVAERG